MYSYELFKDPAYAHISNLLEPKQLAAPFLPLLSEAARRLHVRPSLVLSYMVTVSALRSLLKLSLKPKHLVTHFIPA